MASSLLLRTFLGGVATGAAALAYARWEAQSYRRTERRVDALAAGQPGLRVLHLSDLHMTPGRRKLQDWVAALADLDPDLVLVTGDFLGHHDAVDPVMRALAPLFGTPGAFVLGSNDYYAPRLINPLMYFAGPSDLDPHRPELPWPELVERLNGSGWHHLRNERAILDIGGRAVELRGVDDPHIGRDDYAAIAGAPGAAVSIGLAHAPYRRVIDAMAADGVDLMLAGHTHGGQVCVPGVGALVTNCDISRREAKGLSAHRRPGRDRSAEGGADMWLHVSAGLGTSPTAPIRFACAPEATLLLVEPRATGQPPSE